MEGARHLKGIAVRTILDFLVFFWNDLMDWLAHPARLEGSSGALVDPNWAFTGALEAVDRKAIEFLVVMAVLVPSFGLFLGKAASLVFDFWFGVYA